MVVFQFFIDLLIYFQIWKSSDLFFNVNFTRLRLCHMHIIINFVNFWTPSEFKGPKCFFPPSFRLAPPTSLFFIFSFSPTRRCGTAFLLGWAISCSPSSTASMADGSTFPLHRRGSPSILLEWASQNHWDRNKVLRLWPFKVASPYSRL